MRLKHLARTTQRPAGDIVVEVMNAMPPDAVATMTSVELLKKKVQYLRQQAGVGRGRVPNHRNGWEVPQDLRSFVENGERFLQWDSGPDDPNRILIFASDASILRLHTVEHFFSDGYMGGVPLFQQMYSIHGKMVSLSIHDMLTD